MNLQVIFLLFMIYSTIGYLMEVALVSVQKKKITDRGFLIGPYCPIYGTGALLISLFLTKYTTDIPVLFVMSCLLGASLEYFTSYIMEKIFKTRWWDYSDHKYNINGRISLTTTLGFGALGVILIHYLNPFFMTIITKIPILPLNIITTIIAIIFITDIITSFNIISKIKLINQSTTKDTTEEITKKVKETLKKHSYFTKRLTEAFPNLKVNIKDTIKKIKEKSPKDV